MSGNLVNTAGGFYKRTEVGVYKLLNSITKKGSTRFRSTMVSLKFENYVEKKYIEIWFFLYFRANSCIISWL